VPIHWSANVGSNHTRRAHRVGLGVVAEHQGPARTRLPISHLGEVQSPRPHMGPRFARFCPGSTVRAMTKPPLAASRPKIGPRHMLRAEGEGRLMGQDHKPMRGRTAPPCRGVECGIAVLRAPGRGTESAGARELRRDPPGSARAPHWTGPSTGP
jgi:hypothetical protein